MSVGISQINYWISSPKGDDTTKEGGPGATYLSYKVFMILSVLGGFMALDHLYLRSPMTFVGKIIVNLLFFGIWWLYDASQAIFNTEVVKVFGLGIPGLGPQGIAAGVLGNEVPDKKHMAFFFYGISLFFGGLLGIDSFLVGDHTSGYIRLISTITIIFSFISIFWWLYNIFYFIFDTKSVIDQYPDYFGAPSSGGVFSYFGNYLTSKFPFLKPFIGIFGTAKKVATTALGSVGEVASKGIDLADKTRQTVEDTAKAATTALSLAPWAASFPHELTESTVRQAMQKGGETIDSSESGGGILTYLLVGTIGLIAVSGFVLTYLRSNKNANTPRQDDAPPEPRVLRKPDQKKSTHST
jgi:hypothetical protein